MDDNQLFKKYEKLVWHVAWKMKRSYGLDDEDVEDIAQAAFLRLIALPPAKRKYPAAYHRTVINNACRTELDRIRKHRDNILSYDVPCNAIETFGDGFEDPAPPLENEVINRLMVDRCLDRLEERGKQIVSLTSGLDGNDPLSPALAARRIGITKHEVELGLETSLNLMRSVIESRPMRIYGTRCEVCDDIEIMLVPVGSKPLSAAPCLNCATVTKHSTLPAQVHECTIGI
jgi:RNA polymerase sigma factor (sigma-70 family)